MMSGRFKRVHKSLSKQQESIRTLSTAHSDDKAAEVARQSAVLGSCIHIRCAVSSPSCASDDHEGSQATAGDRLAHMLVNKSCRRRNYWRGFDRRLLDRPTIHCTTVRTGPAR